MNRRLIAPAAIVLALLILLAGCLTLASHSAKPRVLFSTATKNNTVPAVAVTATPQPSPTIQATFGPPAPPSWLPGSGGRLYSLPVKSELAAYARKHKDCGKPVDVERWHGGRVTLRLTHCTITARFSIQKFGTPPPLPTIRPTSTNTPTLTPIPASTATPVPQDAVSRLLGSINDDRAAHGAPPLTLNPVLIAGHPPSCYGARAHAQAMSDSSTKDGQVEIWHQDSRYPAESFSSDVCAGNYPIGQNVGYAGGAEDEALATLQTDMLNEQWAPGCGPPPGAFDDHACNLRSPAFHQVGIAAVQGYEGYWFLVETFTA